MKKILFVLFLAIMFISLQTDFSVAQCALCKETAASSLKEGNTSAAGLNVGIFYLLLAPYALIGGLGYWWYNNDRKKKLLEKSVSSQQ